MMNSEINSGGGILCNRCRNANNNNPNSTNDSECECKNNRFSGESLISLLTSSSSASPTTSKYNHNNHHFYYYNNNKRFNFNFINNKLILLLLRLTLLTILFVIFGISIIIAYDKFTTPDFNSDLYNSTFTCHDSLTCEKQYLINHHRNNSINTLTPIPTTSTSTSTSPNNVFISSLYSDNYLPGILLLGYTIKKHHPNHKMYLIYFPDKLSKSTICQVKKIGWIPKIVERVPPPWEGVHFSFVDQFTKLQIWSFTEYDSLIYIDGDAIVTNKIDHLFELVNGKTGFEFAAAPDVWNGKTTLNFNAGLMLIKPNDAVYKEIMRVHRIHGTYDINFAEQAFLNEYFRFRYLQLPQLYNTNISIMNKYPHLWKVLLNDIKVVHYTSQKPFMKPNPGIFKEPYDLWNQLYQEMNINLNLSKIGKDCCAVDNCF